VRLVFHLHLGFSVKTFLFLNNRDSANLLVDSLNLDQLEFNIRIPALPDFERLTVT